MSQKLSAADHSHKIQGKKLLMHIEFYKKLEEKKLYQIIFKFVISNDLESRPTTGLTVMYNELKL